MSRNTCILRKNLCFSFWIFLSIYELVFRKLKLFLCLVVFALYIYTYVDGLEHGSFHHFCSIFFVLYIFFFYYNGGLVCFLEIQFLWDVSVKMISHQNICTIDMCVYTTGSNIHITSNKYVYMLCTYIHCLQLYMYNIWDTYLHTTLDYVASDTSIFHT